MGESGAFAEGEKEKRGGEVTALLLEREEEGEKAKAAGRARSSVRFEGERGEEDEFFFFGNFFVTALAFEGERKAKGVEENENGGSEL
jgi:hypothetical protein